MCVDRTILWATLQLFGQRGLWGGDLGSSYLRRTFFFGIWGSLMGGLIQIVRFICADSWFQCDLAIVAESVQGVCVRGLPVQGREGNSGEWR